MGKSFTNREDAETYADERGIGKREETRDGRKGEAMLQRKVTSRDETGKEVTRDVNVPVIEQIGVAFVVNDDDDADDADDATSRPARRTTRKPIRRKR